MLAKSLGGAGDSRCKFFEFWQNKWRRPRNKYELLRGLYLLETAPVLRRHFCRTSTMGSNVQTGTTYSN